MKLSIVTINYNNANGLKSTLNSVLNQSTTDFEYVVIDGGSKDQSLDLIMQNDQRIEYYVSEPDKGIYDAMNKGILAANGEYLMFLNSGDLLADEKVVELCLKNIEEHKDVDIFYGDIWGIVDSKADKWLHTHPESIDLVFLQTQNINHQSSLIRKSVFDDCGLYPNIYRLAGDHWLFLKALVRHKLFYHINYPLVIYDYSGASAISRAAYIEEMYNMWANEVPAHLNELVSKYNKLNFERKKRFVKAGIKLHDIISSYKNKLKR